jgi:hypothetical protein
MPPARVSLRGRPIFLAVQIANLAFAMCSGVL